MWRGRGANDPFIIRHRRPLVSSPACRPFRLYLPLVIVARARARIWDTVFHYRVRNKSFVPPATNIGESSDLETALFIPARVPRYVSARDYKSSDRNTYERVRRHKCQIKSRKNEIQIALYFVTIGSIRRATCLERFRRRRLLR